MLAITVALVLLLDLISTSGAAVATSSQLSITDCLNALPPITTSGCEEVSFKAALTTALTAATTSPYCASSTSDAVLAALLGTITSVTGDFQTKVCNPARATARDNKSSDFYKINPAATSPTWYKRFFDGDTFLNEHVDDDEGLRGKTEGAFIGSFRDTASSTIVTFPEEIQNFKSCAIEAAMCCWVQDRQANDNNGGCADNTYAANCTNKNPGDNTDVCYIDLGLAPTSHKMNNGLAFFDAQSPGGREGDSHCHGFAWSNKKTDSSSRYLGNSLYFVSMFDHLYSRGYSKNLAGAPMCGCIDQMPLVTRADCTQTNVDETYTFVVTNGVFSTSVTNIAVTFQACQATTNNDLNSYWKMINAANATRAQLIDDYLVENRRDSNGKRGCGFAIERRLNAGFYGVKRTIVLPTKAPTKSPTRKPAIARGLRSRNVPKNQNSERNRKADIK